MNQPTEQLTENDLNRVFIRAQTEDGRWVSIDAKEATDNQFETWAKSLIEIQGNDGDWRHAERAAFCNQLYQAGMLHIIKKEEERTNE